MLQGVSGGLGDPGLPGPTGLRGEFGDRVSVFHFYTGFGLCLPPWFIFKVVCKMFESVSGAQSKVLNDPFRPAISMNNVAGEYLKEFKRYLQNLQGGVCVHTTGVAILSDRYKLTPQSGERTCTKQPPVQNLKSEQSRPLCPPWFPLNQHTSLFPPLPLPQKTNLCSTFTDFLPPCFSNPVGSSWSFRS